MKIFYNWGYIHPLLARHLEDLTCFSERMANKLNFSNYNES
jgi:hypothetical protein